MQRAQQEAPYRPPQILNRLAEVGQNSISLLAMVGLLLSLHWAIALILFVGGLPSMLVRVKYTRVLYRWQRKVTPQERQGMYLAWMLTSDQFAKEIRLFDLGSYFSQWYLKIRRQIYKESLTIVTARSLANFGLSGDRRNFNVWSACLHRASSDPRCPQTRRSRLVLPGIATRTE